MDLGDGSKEGCIRWGSREVAIVNDKDMPGHARRHSAMSCAKMAEPIDFPVKLWTLVQGQGSTVHKFNRILQVSTVSPHGGTLAQPGK